MDRVFVVRNNRLLGIHNSFYEALRKLRRYPKESRIVRPNCKVLAIRIGQQQLLKWPESKFAYGGDDKAGFSSMPSMQTVNCRYRTKAA